MQNSVPGISYDGLFFCGISCDREFELFMKGCCCPGESTNLHMLHGEVTG